MPPARLSRSGKSARTADSPISFYIQKAFENPSNWSRSPPDSWTKARFPVEDIRAAAAEILSDAADGPSRAPVWLHARECRSSANRFWNWCATPTA